MSCRAFKILYLTILGILIYLSYCLSLLTSLTIILLYWKESQFDQNGMKQGQTL